MLCIKENFKCDQEGLTETTSICLVEVEKCKWGGFRKSCRQLQLLTLIEEVGHVYSDLWQKESELKTVG